MAVFMPRTVAAAVVVLFVAFRFFVVVGFVVAVWGPDDQARGRGPKKKAAAENDLNAASEDRTHDLRIMRPTRYQLHYRRHCYAILEARIWPIAHMIAPQHDIRPPQAEPPRRRRA